MLIKNFNILLLISLVIVSSCTNKQNTSDKKSGIDSVAVSDSISKALNTTQIENVAIVKDSVLDNIARFIAGLPQESSSSSFSKLEGDHYWKEYKSSMDTSWNKMYRERLVKIKDWESTTFSSALNDSLRVFYPFSGPDFLHAYYLYPNATEYMLAALEPIVEIPPLDTLSLDVRDKFLDSLGNSLRDIFKKSYFITTHMKNDLKQIKGVLPPLFFFLERSGHELLEMKFITLDSAGVEKEVLAKKLHWEKTPGVKITFRNREDKKIKHLYYFSISISNKGIKDRPEFEKFIASKTPFNTFVKSASYLMHNAQFTEIKKMILANTQSLFQDDTGIPYKDFKKQLNLGIHFYGDYTKPVKDFGDEKFQPDLDSAYKANKNREALPFSLGYHWGSKKQNYMLVKKEVVSSIK